LALTRNPLINTMKVKQILCVKKTKNISSTKSMKTIRENCWNDYSSCEISKFIYSPNIYDLKIIANRKIIAENHIKGYTMQQFQPFFNGKKAFQKGGEFYGNWIHQRAYLLDVFEGIQALLSRGICMTDLKLANTLYDPINRRGMLIDLAGVVIKKDKKALEKCKLKYVKEITKEYTAPELLAALEKNETRDTICLNLCKCLSYSLGIICEKTGKYTKQIENLIPELKCLDVKKRISVEEGLEILKKSEAFHEDLISSIEDRLPELAKKLKLEIEKNLAKFELNSNLKKIHEFLINLKCSQFDPERYTDLDLFDLNEEFQHFQKGKKPIFVLLGSSGSGKSTFLQFKYLEALDNWKKGDPFPFFMNLACQEELKNRWEWLMNEIGEIDFKLSFFSGNTKYPMTLFLDSFDEVPSKTNLISCIFDELSRNPLNKFIISCRSEFYSKGRC